MTAWIFEVDHLLPISLCVGWDISCCDPASILCWTGTVPCSGVITHCQKLWLKSVLCPCKSMHANASPNTKHSTVPFLSVVNALHNVVIMSRRRLPLCFSWDWGILPGTRACVKALLSEAAWFPACRNRNRIQVCVCVFVFHGTTIVDFGCNHKQSGHAWKKKESRPVANVERELGRLIIPLLWKLQMSRVKCVFYNEVETLFIFLSRRVEKVWEGRYWLTARSSWRTSTATLWQCMRCSCEGSGYRVSSFLIYMSVKYDLSKRL